MFTRGTQADLVDSTETADTGVGASDSSSEDDDEPSTEEAADEAREKVAFKLSKEFFADPLTATALIQVLRKCKFVFTAHRA